MKKIVVLSTIFVAVLMLVACGRGPQETPVPSLPPSPTPAEAPEETPPVSNLQSVTVDEIANISWQWAAQFVRDPASQSVIPAPQSYTILFKTDNSFAVRADCNSGSGIYSVDGSNITLAVEVVTEAVCDQGSLSKNFLTLLQGTGSFGMQEGVLVLVSKDGNTQISFTNGGSAAPAITLDMLSPLAQEGLVDIHWQLTTVYETASQLLVPNPEDYSVIFRQDGALEITADCNSSRGTYQIDNGQISITLDASTLADCGADSLSNTFLEWLSQATAIGGRENDLVLASGEEASFLEFQNAGEVPLEPQVCAWVDLRSLKIDAQALTAATQPYCLPGTAYDDTQPPGPSGLPEHVEILFDAALAPEQAQANDPILYIIPVSEYKQQWNASGNPAVADAIESLSSVLRSQPDELPASGMPVLPYERLTGLNDLAVQAEFLDIQMGYGLRFVGRFAEDPAPVTNDNPQLFYIFLGLSDDGRYLISFFYPVSTDNLSNAADVSDEERAAADNNYPRYLADKVESLNALEPSAWEPDLTVLDGMIASLSFEYSVPAEGAGLMDNLWLWSGLVMTEPASRSVISNPQNYTLVFLPDGSLNIVADCNAGTGSYTLVEEALSIEVGLITRTSCERRSLSEQFVTLLAQASAYRFDQNQLVIALGEDVGSMLFIFGGPVIDLPAVSDDAPRLTALEVINVRSGPGVQYPSFGVAPAGIRAEVVGVSQDGKWWVVKVPADFAADEQGWISAEFVEAFNAAGVPVIPIPELGEIELVAPEEGKPTATALEPVNVRSGPGVQYPSFGIAPLDAKMEIVGVSPDGQWWVVKIPTTLDPEGQGWVSADFVTATNTQNVPAITPPLP